MVDHRLRWSGELSLVTDGWGMGVPQGLPLGPLLCKDCISPPIELIHSHGISSHGYADDTHSYVTFKHCEYGAGIMSRLHCWREGLDGNELAETQR